LSPLAACGPRLRVFRLPSINATTAAGKRRGAGMGNDTVARVATVDMKNNWRGRLQRAASSILRGMEPRRIAPNVTKLPELLRKE